MKHDDAPAIDPLEVIRVLNEAEVVFVLMGAHGILGWVRDERATIDVDVLVRKSHHKKAMAAIEEAFPHLERRDSEVVTRYVDPRHDRIVLDLMKPMHDVHLAVFKRTVDVGTTHRVPDLEMALTCKFAAMVSPYRQRPKKFIDAHDFMAIVECNQSDIDRDKLRDLGELVYPGGGDEIIQLLEDTLAGRTLQL